jgi:hypothetical protein
MSLALAGEMSRRYGIDSDALRASKSKRKARFDRRVLLFEKEENGSDQHLRREEPRLHVASLPRPSYYNQTMTIHVLS